VKGTVGGVIITYIGNYYVCSGSTATSYYYAGSVRVAMRPGSTLSYLFADQLGSTSVVANSSGSKTAEVRYKAWCEDRYTSGTVPSGYRYTGQRYDSYINLYWYNSRWYDSALGRFVQADSIVPGLQGSKVPIEPQAWDRYSYANNNPVRYNDPSGHCIDGVSTIVCVMAAGAIIGGAVSTVAYYTAAKVTGHDVTLSGLAGAFAGGALAGAVSVVATPLAGTLLGVVGVEATGAALLGGATAVNAAGGAASYLAGGYTQNAVDKALGNTPTFKPSAPAAITSAGVSAVLTPGLSAIYPVANNTVSTLAQAHYFMPGRTIPTLFATQNARNMYSQAAISVGVGSVLATGLSEDDKK
jgi:RHS repeat-associated protein